MYDQQYSIKYDEHYWYDYMFDVGHVSVDHVVYDDSPAGKVRERSEPCEGNTH